MHKFSKIKCLVNQLFGILKIAKTRFLVLWMILSALISSCKTDPHDSNWVNENSLSISQYVEKNREEYSKFHKLMAESKMLNTLYAYNPYGNDYTLFLPTDKAIDNFILKNKKYISFDELIKDTGFIKTLVRYHTINNKVHSDEFPDGALNDRTLTGDRLVIGFYIKGDNQLIKVNNTAPVIKSNLKMANGYIHVISEVLQQAETTGYDWLQQQHDYSILAQAMELSGIRKRLTWNKYSILAEHDSVYHRKGIKNIEDLINRIATPGKPYSDRTNSFYQFVAYHILNGEYYLNDLNWGSKKYQNMSTVLLTINVGLGIQINPCVDTYEITVSGSGDTTEVNYIRPVWENCNMMTRTGPVHSISDVLYFKPLS